MSQIQNPPQVSVIISSYNSASYIAATLETAISQTYRNREIIVVDGGSTDDTCAITEGYRDRGVTLFLQPNSSQGIARNWGMAAAKGELIAFLDSDDLWDPEFIQTMVNFLTLHPETSIAFADVLFFGSSKFAGRRFQEVYPPNVPITFAKLAGLRSHICYSAMLRREILERVGVFDAELRAAEDFDLWLRALHAGCRIEPVPKVLARYRRHASSASRQPVTPLLAVLQVLQKWRDREDLTTEEREAVETSYAEFLHRFNVASALDGIRKAQYSTAADFLLKAEAKVPNWRFHAARVGLAVAPGIVRFALRKIRG
jgi:glycosyltransferase involved in cell wall biosynthesis